MPRFTGTPETEKKGGRFGGVLEVKDAPEMVPSYDPMGMPTGYTEAAPQMPAEPMSYAEQMKKVGEAYGAVGRGAVKGFLGTPGELEYLGAYALPEFLGAKKTPEKQRVEIFPRAETVGKMMEEVGLGKTPEQLKGMEFIGELLGGLKGYGGRPAEIGAGAVKKLTEPSALQKALSTVQLSGEQLAAAAKRAAGERLTAVEEKALSSAVEAVDRQMTRISGLKEVTAKASPEVEQMRVASRNESKLAKPDLEPERLAKTDIESRINELASKKLGRAEEIQKIVGGTRFQSFEDVARARQETMPFNLSPQGEALQKELQTIIKGGPEGMQIYTQEERTLASNIMRDLFPKDKAIDFGLVDKNLRKLRQIEQTKAPELASQISRTAYKNAGDLIERRLADWVGLENYPRKSYGVASEAKNKFATKLGEALTAREEIPFAREKGMKEVPRPSKILFDSRDSVNFGKELLGEKEVAALAEQHASNLIKDMDASQIRAWLDSGPSEFVSEIEGLSEKINQYGQALAKREGDAKAFAELQKQAAKKIGEAEKGIAEAKGAAVKETAEAQKAFDTAQKSADELTRALSNEDPAKLYSSFTKMRPKLEETGVFDKAALDALEADISRASNIADARQRRDAIVGAVGTMLKKIVTLGLR